ncbi:MAG: hypothetical protein ACK5NC_11505 [Vibrio sp.]
MKTDEFAELVKQYMLVTENTCSGIRKHSEIDADHCELDRLILLRAKCDQRIQEISHRINNQK